MHLPEYFFSSIQSWILLQRIFAKIRYRIDETVIGRYEFNQYPQLLAVLLSDPPGIIKKEHDLVDTICYADDFVLYSSSRIYLKRALRTLEEFSISNGLVINKGKTKSLKFGTGGPTPNADIFRLTGEQIEKVNRFEYLGISLNTKGLAVSEHVIRRPRMARQAFGSIPSPQSLSMDTSLALFNLKSA